MISITSYAKGKKSSQSSGNGGGGGFANAQIYNNGFNPFYLWGQYVDGRDTINGDLISNGTITGNKIVSPQGNIDLIYALSEYVNYISGHTAVFDNLSGDTAHFNQDVFVGGDIDIVGDTNITGDTTIYGDLAVSGDTHLKDVWTQNINNSDTIKTKNLEVTGLAHFFQLVIDRIKAAGGAILLTPADGFETALVEEDASGYTLYFHAKDGEKQISNMWEVNDQAICQTFNASTGTSYNVSNTYYWALVTEVSEQAVQKTVSGNTEEYHYIKLSKSVYDGELNPKVGDEIAMLGSRNDEDPQRQSAIYMAAYTSLDQGLTAPCFAEYKGINDFSLSSHRHSYIDATGASFTGDFRIDNNTTIQDYVNSATTEIRNEFRFDTEGLYSRVSKMTNPNILPANGWTDQDDKALLQEDDEEYIFEEPQQTRGAKSASDLIGMPPIIYLNADTYTFSIYSQVKFEDIQYGYTKDNLNMTLPVQTAFNSGDTWHSQARAITTFVAPIDGYYHLGAKIMGSDYTGDYEWVDPDGDGESGYTPTESGITTSIEISMQSNKVIASVTPSDFNGTITWQSSNPTACTIDQEGNLTVLTTGSTVITASIPEQYHNGKHYLGSNDTLNLSIQPIQINYTGLPLSGLTEGAIHNLNASTTPTGGTLSYVSANPAIASVDNNGIITAMSSGMTTITINAGGVTDAENNIVYQSASTTTTVAVEESINYLRITAESASTVTFSFENASQNPNEISYRKNGSRTWTTVTSTTEVQMSENDYLDVKGNINNEAGVTSGTIVTSDIKTYILADGKISLSGYLMALIKNNAITDETNFFGNSTATLRELFSGNGGLVSAKDLVVARDTTAYCYFGMFYGCTSLVNPPSLPASAMSEGCYKYMFGGCTSMTSAPVLVSTSLAKECYMCMFIDCRSLVTAPQLPATTMAVRCYQYMFESCTSLTTAPQLPATTLAIGCYEGMFQSCTSLTTAPDLPATTLANFCYEGMFLLCSNLVTPPSVLPATTIPHWAYEAMFYGCTSLTTTPILSATTFGEMSCGQMFQECTSLTSMNGYILDGQLSANCFDRMFKDCIHLESISTKLVNFNTGLNPFNDWLDGVHTNGTLFAPSNAGYTASQTKLPSTWTLNKTQHDWTTSAQTISYTDLPQSGLTVGETHNLNASAQGTLSYSSSNSSIASVNSSGVVTALASGNTTITITASSYNDNANYIHYTSASTTVSVTVQASQSVPISDSKYFVIQALTGTTVSLNTTGSPTGSISYRKNGTGSWTTLSSGVSLTKDDYLELKGNYATNNYFSDYVTFSASTPSSIIIGGYLAALQNNAEIDSSNNTISSPFSYLFSGCTGLVSAEYLNLPSNTVYCTYYGCFYGCTNLVTPPSVLPETTLKTADYRQMFYNCSNLETTPVISATTLDSDCFRSMFYNCSKITSLTVYFTSPPSVSSMVRDWLRNNTTAGICYCPSSATYSASDINLPSTWTLSKTL